MPTHLNAPDMLDMFFLDLRHKIIDVAAGLDRLDAPASGERIDQDPRVAKLEAALAVLSDGKSDRARRVQMVFSDEYDERWAAWS